MINYDLPKEIEIDGVIYPITKGGDYRVILDVITALNDTDLSEQEKIFVCFLMFYGEIPQNQEAAWKKMMWFINCGEEENRDKKPEPPVMDWEQDFSLLIAPINKVLGVEIRSVDYLHWWTFISGYTEIGECTFKNVVDIRRKRAKGQKLDKSEAEYFRKNPEKVILKNKVSQEDIDFIIGDW